VGGGSGPAGGHGTATGPGAPGGRGQPGGGTTYGQAAAPTFGQPPAPAGYGQPPAPGFGQPGVEQPAGAPAAGGFGQAGGVPGAHGGSASAPAQPTGGYAPAAPTPADQTDVMGQPVGTPPPGGFGPGNGHQPPGQRGGPGFGPPPNQYGPPRPGGGRPDQNQQHQQHQQHQDDEDWDDEDDDLGDRIRGHSHGHGHTRTPVSAHTKRIVFAIVIPCMVATVVGLVLLWPGKVATPSGDAGSEQRAYGTITSVDEIPCPPVPAGAPSAGTANQPCGEAGVKVTSGTGSGTQIIVDLPQGPGAPTVKTGDTVVLSYTPAVGNDVPAKYQIVDHDRGKALIYVLALCGAIIIVFGRLR